MYWKIALASLAHLLARCAWASGALLANAASSSATRHAVIHVAVLVACRHYSPPNPGFFGWIWSLEWCGALGAQWQKMQLIAIGQNLTKKSHNQAQVRIHAL